MTTAYIIITSEHDRGIEAAIISGGRMIAEYLLSDEQAVDDLRSAIDAHIADGGTIGNYQW